MPLLIKLQAIQHEFKMYVNDLLLSSCLCDLMSNQVFSANLTTHLMFISNVGHIVALYVHEKF